MGVGLATACGGDGDPAGPGDGGPTAARLVLEVPDTVVAETDFAITVTARTDAGQVATDFSGPVTLTAGGGTVAPSSLTLSAGTVRADVQVSGLNGAIVLTARSGTLEGSAGLTLLAPLDRLVGDPDDPAVAAIPVLEYRVEDDDFSTGHPDLPGLPMTVDIVLVGLSEDARVGAVNELLAAIDAEIIGGIPGVADEAPGLLMLRTPTGTHEGMEGVLATLRSSPVVAVALQDVRLQPDRVTRDNGGQPADWDWATIDFGGNWGMKRVRAPHLWNLNPGIGKAIGAGTSRASGTLVLDAEFAPTHPDLGYSNLTPTRIGAHGTQVAGVIGAVHDNGLGVDGLNPFAVLTAAARESAGTLISDYLAQTTANPTLRVVNISLGFNWYLLQPPVDPDTDPAAQAQASQAGTLFALGQRLLAAQRSLPVVAASAGNGGPKNARFNSPPANAALEHGQANVLVVEALENDRSAPGGTALAFYSGINGHLSAPGSAILTTGDSAKLDGYATVFGTSAAAPHVAGLVGYLYTLDPSLPDPTAGSNPVGDLLVRTGTPLSGGAAPRIDAYAAAHEAGGLRTVSLLTDFDDGTPDGNLRVDPGSGSPFLGTDADGDGGPGDGAVDMSDFRRWRDGYLYLVGPQTTRLDGADDHPKKDLNGSGAVDYISEFFFSFVDLNGDNDVDATATAYLPGAFNADVTDLQVLQRVFDDPHYDASELGSLLLSADIAIHPTALRASGVAAIRSSVTAPGTQATWQERLHTGVEADGDGMYQVYTVPVGVPGETWSVRVVGLDANGTVVEALTDAFSVHPGEDHFWDPDPAGNTGASLSWTFDSDLEGWMVEERGRDAFPWGTVGWNSREGGVVVFDGVGYDGSPNSWIQIQVDLPADARRLRYRSSAHDRGDGAASLRVRLEPDGAPAAIVQDWEELSTGPDGFDWVQSTLDISAWAGQRVTLYFEHADIDGGGNNQRWLDDIEIVN